MSQANLHCYDGCTQIVKSQYICYGHGMKYSTISSWKLGTYFSSFKQMQNFKLVRSWKLSIPQLFFYYFWRVMDKLFSFLKAKRCAISTSRTILQADSRLQNTATQLKLRLSYQKHWNPPPYWKELYFEWRSDFWAFLHTLGRPHSHLKSKVAVAVIICPSRTPAVLCNHTLWTAEAKASLSIYLDVWEFLYSQNTRSEDEWNHSSRNRITILGGVQARV